MVYNPLETKLLKSARRAGATAVTGLEMFVGQALEQIRLWLGRKVRDDNYFDFFKNFLKELIEKNIPNVKEKK
jgi:shikimate 5-dehydrogenase